MSLSHRFRGVQEFRVLLHLVSYVSVRVSVGRSCLWHSEPCLKALTLNLYVFSYCGKENWPGVGGRFYNLGVATWSAASCDWPLSVGVASEGNLKQNQTNEWERCYPCFSGGAPLKLSVSPRQVITDKNWRHYQIFSGKTNFCSCFSAEMMQYVHVFGDGMGGPSRQG